MGRPIIKQPDGLYAEFSSITETFNIWDATEEDLIEFIRKRAADEAEESARRFMASDTPRKMKWEEAVRKHNQNSEKEYRIEP